jgi:sialate O-acetylesterase
VLICGREKKLLALMIKNILFVFILSILSIYTALAKVKLPKIFGNGMVLQQNQAIPIWGWADKNEKITVQFNNQTKTTKADSKGRWKIALQPEKAGGPFQLIVKGKDAITISDVLVGEVWICSGQSNMEWPLREAKDGKKEIQEANYPSIRHIYIPKAVSSTPEEDLKENTSWKSATSENVGEFTAVGYFFAKELFKELNVPIGLIHTSWGGTDVETWTSREAFANDDEFKSMITSVPQIDLQSLTKKKKEEILSKIKEVQGGLPTKAELASWSTLSFDDSKWSKLKAPGIWEGQSLGDFDGIVWYRKTVNLTAEEAGKPAVLELAKVDDKDETFVNGTLVGSVNQYSAERVYQVPAGLLKEGKNVIAIRITDTGGGGGIHGDADHLKLTINNNNHSLAGEWSFAIESVPDNSSSIGPNTYPSLLYNAMISPLIPYAVKGAIWYQGENNAGRAYQYRKSFPLMISDWRKQWAQGEFPFYFVQLASFDASKGNSNQGSGWAELREAQTLTLSLPNTGMAVTTDIGESHDIHPRNKTDVGKRLAVIALNKSYGKNIVSSGPVYKSMKTDGNKVSLFFTNTGSGLNTTDKYGYIKGFEVAGEDKKFYYAKAAIEGDRVVVYSENVQTPVAVRYAWADDAGDANLYNKEGLPAVPFRTDNWKGITEGSKYRIP